MHYPLTEKIGNPDLLTGREKEFRLINKWLSKIPDRASKSRVIAARRKSGKTVFIQRIFNILWSENGAVIPFYLDIPDKETWLPDFAIDYYRAFASHYISFLERDESLVKHWLSPEQIREYGRTHSIKLFVDDINLFLEEKHPGGSHDRMWTAASSAPHRFAGVYDLRFVVILDEFQHITQYIHRDEACAGKPIKSMAGSYLSLSESKLAPMLVTGSYPGMLMKILGKYLKGARLSRTRMEPYLTPEEGLQAVYKYAEVCGESITNETAVQINELCMADPFFISCVFQNDYGSKDLNSPEGVIDAVNYEVSDRDSDMSGTWNEYILITLERLNGRETKQLLLHLSKYNDRYWTHQDLKEKLPLDSEPDEIQRKLVILAESDMIDRGSADIDFRGLRDGSLNLILRHRFEKEIEGLKPDFKPEFQAQIADLTLKNRKLQGMLNHLSGKMAENILATAMRSRKRFILSEFFSDAKDAARLNITAVKERVPVQREDGKAGEIDIVAKSECGRSVLAEVKKTKTKSGLRAVKDFHEKTEIYRQSFPAETILPAFLSLGGFTEEALVFCQEHGIAVSNRIQQF
ncbi:MAG: hypothetical protein GY862_34415 [Gammaproteobacteria bacterium]|nr:hypothetical protein [Gammaproteobacteria bacterium]